MSVAHYNDFTSVTPAYAPAAELRWAQDRRRVVFVSLPVSGTSTSSAHRPTEAGAGPQRAEGTTLVDVEFEAGRVEPRRESTRTALCKLRLISGLTFEQLGELFDVTRRSVHAWISGKPLSAEHETRLHHVFDIVRSADRGDVRATRAALLEVHDGTSAFELLAGGRFEEARARLGIGAQRRRPATNELSPEAKAARAPSRPDELVGALQDRVNPSGGPLLASRPIKTRSA